MFRYDDRPIDVQLVLDEIHLRLDKLRSASFPDADWEPASDERCLPLLKACHNLMIALCRKKGIDSRGDLADADELASVLAIRLIRYARQHASISPWKHAHWTIEDALRKAPHCKNLDFDQEAPVIEDGQFVDRYKPLVHLGAHLTGRQAQVYHMEVTNFWTSMGAVPKESIAQCLRMTPGAVTKASQRARKQVSSRAERYQRCDDFQRDERERYRTQPIVLRYRIGNQQETLRGGRWKAIPLEIAEEMLDGIALDDLSETVLVARECAAALLRSVCYEGSLIPLLLALAESYAQRRVFGRSLKLCEEILLRLELGLLTRPSQEYFRATTRKHIARYKMLASDGAFVPS